MARRTRMETKIIGKITATENRPTSFNTVRFWISDNEVIKIFDVVRIQHINNSHTYAIITDLQYITDSVGHLANYVSSDFGDTSATAINKRLGTTIAEADVLYNSKDIEMPVREGAIVETADNEGVRIALGLVGFEQPIPGGYISMSYGAEVPIDFESDYLLGPEGAHLNIAGMSGLATKTSYAMFLLNSIQQKIGNEVSIILFNVKGNDLLAIDENTKEPLSNEQTKEWEKCGLKPEPFKKVRYLYPYSQQRNKNYFTISRPRIEFIEKQHHEGRAFNYYYDVKTMIDKMPLLLCDVDDPLNTLESIYSQLHSIDASNWDTFKHRIEEKTKSSKSTGKATGGESINVQSWRKFNRFLQTRTNNPIFVEKSLTDTAKKRQILIADAVRKLRPGDVLVIDIEPLPDYIQCLVVGDVITTIRNIKLGDDEELEPNDIGKIIVFADELNKYGPKTDSGGRSLTSNLLEITERGRSLGIILFGAEQFRSGVHDRILGNCSTNVYGRTSPVEMAKCQDYRYFSNSHKASITRLEKGSLLLQHAVFKTDLIKVRFPFPCYYKEDVKK